MNSAIIGLGVIGKVHYDTLKKQGENVVAICDIDSGKLANFSADRKYDDYKKMLDDEQRASIVYRADYQGI